MEGESQAKARGPNFSLIEPGGHLIIYKRDLWRKDRFASFKSNVVLLCLTTKRIQSFKLIIAVRSLMG